MIFRIPSISTELTCFLSLSSNTIKFYNFNSSPRTVWRKIESDVITLQITLRNKTKVGRWQNFSCRATLVARINASRKTGARSCINHKGGKFSKCPICLVKRLSNAWSQREYIFSLTLVGSLLRIAFSRQRVLWLRNNNNNKKKDFYVFISKSLPFILHIFYVPV